MLQLFISEIILYTCDIFWDTIFTTSFSNNKILYSRDFQGRDTALFYCCYVHFQITREHYVCIWEKLYQNDSPNTNITEGNT